MNLPHLSPRFSQFEIAKSFDYLIKQRVEIEVILPLLINNRSAKRQEASRYFFPEHIWQIN